MKKILKYFILIIVTLLFMGLFNNVYASDDTINLVETYLPDNITIPISKGYITDDYNFILKSEGINQNINNLLKKYISNILEEKNLSDYVNYEINSFNNKSVSIYVSPIENSDTFVLDFNNYIQFIKNGYFNYYYRITYNGTTSVKPFKVYANEEINMNDYNTAKDILNKIQESYVLSIDEIYNLHKKWDNYNYVIDQIICFLETKGVTKPANVDFDYCPISTGNYNNSTMNLNDFFRFELSIRVNGTYLAIKTVQYRVDNTVFIPNNIEQTETGYANYLKDYLETTYFPDKEIEVSYENDSYILDIDSYKCLLNVIKSNNCFEYGTGTRDDPYIINNSTDLNNIRYYLNCYFKLNSDIDLLDATSNSQGEFYDNGKGWLPIANDKQNTIVNSEVLFEEEKFSGEFDGNGHIISGLCINRFDSDYNGLFGCISENGIVKNLTLKDVNIKGNHCIGGIAGENYGTINNVKVYGNILFEDEETNYGHVYMGGIAGKNYGDIVNAINYANVTSIVETEKHSTYGAGITAYNGKNLIRTSMHHDYDPTGGKIQNCMNFGTIIIKNVREQAFQALAGEAAKASGIAVQNSADIIDVANIGTIISNNPAGIVYYNNAYTLFNAYNIGKLILYTDFYTGTDKLEIGSIATFSDGGIYGVYGYNPKAEYKTLSEELILDNDMSKNEYKTFDFENIWKINCNFNYPILKNMEIESKNINIDVDESDVEVYLSNPTYALKYSVNNLEYDYLIFESDNPNVIIDENGKITISGKEDILANITVKTLFNTNKIVKTIKFKLIDDIYIIGDANLDGKISALDYVKIKNHIMGTNIINNDKQLRAADANKDGKISALDYVRIKNIIMNGGI